MAASTNYCSSSSSSRWMYDVFISFRGEDTRQNFTGHLYMALKNGGVNAFIDDNELRRGKDITEELVRAIEGSKISVIVFSTNYANSGWCLKELVKIMECRRTLQQGVYPIFYDVDPSEVRKQTGNFGKAFKKHEEQVSLDKEEVFIWREALTEAANLSGWDLRNTANGHEAKLINIIVGEISREVNKMHLYVALYPVGLNSRMEEVSSLLSVGSNGVRLVGIWGMGGSGKTTIAKAIYNQFYHCFEGASFLENVREQDLVRLQEKLLFDILNIEIKLSSDAEGMILIKKKLEKRRVLVIVDNVDQVNQLNAIARIPEGFGHGSRILITTRDEHLLKVLEVDAIYLAKEMSSTESLELFSWHAFRRGYPEEEYSQLSSSVTAYCKGLPLALEVLGSFLFSRSKLEWISTLEKLRTTPDDKVVKNLRISYDALSDDKTKDIFLDICCFFIGMDREYVAEILNGSGFCAEIGIKVLLERRLVTIGWKNEMMVHDLLRDMGTTIIKEKYPRDPGKWSRLWLQEDVLDVLLDHSGSKEIEGLSLNMATHSKAQYSTKAFGKMRRMRLLRLNYVQLAGSFESFSKKLNWVCWHGFPLYFIPNELCQENLVAIELQYSNLRQVWKEPKSLGKLKILNLSHSHHLTCTPDFSKLPNLKKLLLKDCPKLSEVHHSIGHLHRLVFLDLEDCKLLKNLPKSFYKLKSLEVLVLSGCLKIDSLDEELGEIVSLRTLIIDNTGITALPPTIGGLKNLVHLSLSGSKGLSLNSLTSPIWSLVKPSKNPRSINLLPPSIQGLACLGHLSLKDCNLSDGSIPKEFWHLSSLEWLSLENNNLRCVAPSISGLPKLRTLVLDDNSQLEQIPDLPPNLVGLFASNCILLERMPSVSECSKMYYLTLSNCHKLVEVPGLNQLSQSRTVFVSFEGSKNISTTFKKTIAQGWATAAANSRICFSGDDIPEWFDYISEGNFTSFELHQTVPSNLEGLAVGVVCSFPLWNPPLSLLYVVNRTKGFAHAFEASTYNYSNCQEDQVWLGHFPYRWHNFESGDEVVVILEPGPGITVKKIGLLLPWDLHSDNRSIHNTTPTVADEDSIVLCDIDQDAEISSTEKDTDDDTGLSRPLLGESAPSSNRFKASCFL